MLFCHTCKTMTNNKELAYKDFIDIHNTHKITALSVDPKKDWKDQNSDTLLHANLLNLPAQQYFNDSVALIRKNKK